MKLEVDPDLIVQDKQLSLNEGALVPWNPISSNYYPEMLRQFCGQNGIDMDLPYAELSNDTQQKLLYGAGGELFHFHYQNEFGGVRDVDIPFEGVITNVNRRYKERDIERFYARSDAPIYDRVCLAILLWLSLE